MTADMRVTDVVAARPLPPQRWNLFVLAWIVGAQIVRGIDLLEPAGALAQIPGGLWWPFWHFVIAGLFGAVFVGVIVGYGWRRTVSDIGVVVFAAVYIARQVAIIDVFGWDRLAVQADAFLLVLFLASTQRNPTQR